MPRVTNISAGRYYHQSTGHLSAGDTVEVSEELAEYLCDERGDFAIVDDVEAGDIHEDGTVEELPEPEDPLEGEPVADADVSEHLDRWLDQPYDHRAEQVRAGDVDDSLGAIEDAETSQTVIDAVDERRAELEAE